MDAHGPHINSLLYTFFTNLKRAGFPLGIEEYKLLLQALREGYMLKSKSALLQLCRLLWLKSKKDSADFDHIFRIAFAGLPEELVRIEKQFQEKDAAPERPERPVKPQAQETGQQPDSSLEPPPASVMPSTPPPLPQIKDEAASLRIQLQARPPDETDTLEQDARNRYALQRDYLPVTQRQMTDIWHRIGNTHPVARLEELDLENTVRDVCQTGFFIHPQFRSARQHSQMLILTDQEGSMVAFEALADRIVETAQRLSYRRKVRRLYFHNIPAWKVYDDPLYLQALELPQILGAANSPYDSLLIISDAGAARGNTDMERISQTVDFLVKTRTLTRRIVWINPMPRFRWRRSSAAVIARYAPMYSVEEQEIKQAILKLL